MNEYYSAGFTIDELANRMGMSARNFARRFSQALGDSPLTYLHKLRIVRARQLLETDFKSVQEICYEVGYDDVPFFRRIFKRYAGLSPKEYRSRFCIRSWCPPASLLPPATVSRAAAGGRERPAGRCTHVRLTAASVLS